jgi:hypothetical protein
VNSVSNVARYVAAWLDRLDLGGWALVLSGGLLLGLTLLMPTYVQVIELSHQRQAAADALANMQQRQANHEQFIAAVENSDPLLLKRLAWHELHLKPAGFATLDDATPAEPGMTERFDRWLAEARALDETPQPDTALPPIPRSRLVRLTTETPARYWMLALGAMLIGCGLLTTVRSEGAESR